MWCQRQIHFFEFTFKLKIKLHKKLLVNFTVWNIKGIPEIFKDLSFENSNGRYTCYNLKWRMNIQNLRANVYERILPLNEYSIKYSLLIWFLSTLDNRLHHEDRTLHPDKFHAQDFAWIKYEFHVNVHVVLIVYLPDI